MHVCDHYYGPDGLCVHCHGELVPDPFVPRRVPEIRHDPNVGGYNMRLAEIMTSRPAFSDWARENSLRSLGEAIRRVNGGRK